MAILAIGTATKAYLSKSRIRNVNWHAVVFQFIHAQFIVEAAPHGIQCSKDVRLEVQHHLSPPFEELFDPAEEYILEVLFEAWSQMIMVDLSTFDKVVILLLITLLLYYEVVNGL